MASVPSAVIFGVAGARPTEAEKRLFAAANALGFILFQRNCVAPDQVRALVGDLRETVGRADAPVLIDQEGGRVVRLKPPAWWATPAAGRLAAVADRDPDLARELVRLNAQLIADDLAALGITVNCAPVLDVPQPGAHDIIGDRAHGRTPERVAELGRAACEGLLAGGVLPVIKHIPGHGRALADSHLELPVVEAPRETLERIDFAPFRALSDMPWAMTAHVVYTALDPAAPATTSARVINDLIRGAIGFDGVLVSDDLCMAALTGQPDERARAVLAAGCDVALHCNGNLTEMQAIAAVCPPLTAVARDRLARAEARRRRPEPFDRAAAIERITASLDGLAGAA